jgi:hypothetical protein
MAVPTSEFDQIANTLLALQLDSAVKRTTHHDPISTGDGNELDFGDVNIGGGSVNSDVAVLTWHVTNWQSNTQVQNFRFWASSLGFDQANTKIKYATWKLDPTSEWVQNATPNDVGNTDLPTSEPSQNVYKASDGTTASILSSGNDTIEAIAMYVAVDGSETIGVYKGVDSGKELRFTLKYDYF